MQAGDISVQRHERSVEITAAGSSAARSAGPPLRLGVVLQGTQIPAWQYVALSRLGAGTFAEIVVAVEADFDEIPPSAAARTSPIEAALVRLADRLDAKMTCEEDALAATDATPVLREVPVVQGRDPRRSGLDADLLRPYDLDILIDFSGCEIAGSAAGAARYGVWRIAHPYLQAHARSTAAFWPVYHRWPVAETVVEAVDAHGDRRAIARFFPAIHPHSIKLTTHAMCWRAASLLPQTVRALHETGELVPDDRVAKLRTPAGRPGSAHLALHIARNVARRARASASRRLMLDQWILMCGHGEPFTASPAQFRKIVPPKDRFWADPHLVHRDGSHYAFIEECPFATGKGHIAVLRIGADGTHDEAVTVLERDYHLSYPFVFEHDGTLYMVPESEANRTIDLYRCVDFPAKWELVTTLMRDVTATDSTLVHRDGRWWLFANMVDVAGASFSEELYLFYSDALVGGEWKPHRRNPIVSDARRARPAGALIRRDGRLYRPAQDCSVRYGYGIRLHEIDTLSELEYHEHEVRSILPTWDSRIVATHTVTHAAGLTMIDALQPRMRF